MSFFSFQKRKQATPVKILQDKSPLPLEEEIKLLQKTVICKDLSTSLSTTENEDEEMKMLKNAAPPTVRQEQAGVSDAGLTGWFQEPYDYLLSTGNMDILQQPLRIFNCDEIGFPIAPKPPKIICETGALNVYV